MKFEISTWQFFVGILPASCYSRWEEKDFEQIIKNGNESVNLRLLGNIPPWQYRPMASDGIKHKVYIVNFYNQNNLKIYSINSCPIYL